MNQVVMVGRVKELPTIRETENGNKIGQLVIEVERSFKNAQGEIEKDEFVVTLWRGIAEECHKSCSAGSVIGVKGRLQANNYSKEDILSYKSEIIAEKVSILG